MIAGKTGILHNLEHPSMKYHNYPDQQLGFIVDVYVQTVDTWNQVIPVLHGNDNDL